MTPRQEAKFSWLITTAICITCRDVWPGIFWLAVSAAFAMKTSYETYKESKP